MKKIFNLSLLIITLVFCLGFCGCGANGANAGFIDLSKMSAGSRYTKMSQIQSKENDYMGTTIKVVGLYSRNTSHHYITVKDPTCADPSCQIDVKMEFVWAGEHTLSDYPPINSSIIICGTLTRGKVASQTVTYILTDTLQVQ